jgi:4-amino-4-deoxy-L-arabinose transferase-like glycosyltransferase
MVAWIIAATTSVCGNGEACIRAGSPLIHFATGLVLFALARGLYDARIGFWSAIVFLTIPGISLSSMIASTDVALLFFWSVALLAFTRWLDAGATRWAIALGAALGLGLLSKYAMGYFVLCAFVYFIVAPDRRRALLRENLLVIIAVAAVVVAPNIWWNVGHGFATVSHTAANASWSGGFFHPEEILVFFGDQLAVFGPVLFAVLLRRVWDVASRGTARLDEPALFLTSFSLPVLAVIFMQSILSRSNANWAAVAYPAATVLVTAWLWQGRRAWGVASLALHGLALFVLSALLASPVLVERFGAANAFKRVRGWEALSAGVHDAALHASVDAILFDDRFNLTSFLYYSREEKLTAFIWDADGVAENHYELTRAFKGQIGGPILLVARQQKPERLLQSFTHVEDRGELVVAVGGGYRRAVHLYRLSDYHGD